MAATDTDLPLLQDESAPIADLLRFAGAPDTPGADAWQALRQVAARSTDYTELTKAARLADRLIAANPPVWRQTVRLALIGGYTTSQMPPLLRFQLATAGIAATVYEAPYGQIAQELLGPSPDLQAFQADLVLIAPTYRDTHVWRAATPGPAEVAADVAFYRQLWQNARAMGMRVLQQNFDLPDVTPLGNLCGVAGPVRWLRELNLRLADAADGVATILDVERLAGSIGTANWSDERFWHMAKQGVALAALPHLCRLQSRMVKAMLGLSAKVLALDLDNTLWGGVIGEDGLAALEIGGTARGEAFVAFQQFCKALRARGVVLAIVSKNNEADALIPFSEHTEMVLRRDDFAAIRANWLPKSGNLRSIAEELNLGSDSLVFFDDNPVERAEVRANAPEVTVIDVPEDPSGYCQALAAAGMFETIGVTAEDRQRADDYRSRALEADLQQATGSLSDFLRAMDQQGTFHPFRETDLPRIYQLVQKSNQFNLTTRRHTEAQLRRFAASAAHEAFALRLVDRFGDRGLIAVVVGEYQGDALVIDTWLMSCRVLGRTVEAATLHQVVARARARGAAQVIGVYRPTAKNALVQDLYPKLGFEALGNDPDGESRWRLAIGPETVLPETFVESLVAD